MIDSLGLAGFFLLHRDLLELAREVAVQVRGPSSVRALLPPGRGRGSSVSSIVCYLTGLSHIDPITNELFLGRFLNEELTVAAGHRPRLPARHPRGPDPARARALRARALGAGGRVPDVPLARRDPRARQGRSACRPGSSSGSRAGRSRGACAAWRSDVESALGIEPGGPPPPLMDLDNRAPFAMSTEEWMAMVNGHDPRTSCTPSRPRTPPRRVYAALPGRWSWLARLCDQAYGLPRHLSQHSGGMIVSTRPLIDCCPVVPAAMEGRQLCQWDKDSCADAGFLKIDLLGLGMLSAVERCVDYIERTRGERIDLSRIPFDDARDLRGDPGGRHDGRVPDRVARADAVAVPHAAREPGRPHDPGRDRAARGRSSAARSTRTSSAASGCGWTRTTWSRTTIPSLEPVLRDTLGTIIFQDQVIEVAMAFAGFSPGEAEGLRRAMSRKRSAAAIEAYHRRFIEGAARHPRGRGGDRRARLHDDRRLLRLRLPEGARGRLRPARLPVDLAARAPRRRSSCARCSTSSRWASTRRTRWRTRPSAAGSRSRRPTSMRARSSARSRRRPPTRVRIGLGYVLGVRREEVEALVAARRARGPFRSLADLASRAGAGRPALEKLAWAGACDELGGSRRTALWQLGVAAPGEQLPRGHAARRCRSRSRRRRSCGRSTAGRGWSPTTRPPASRSARTR